MEPEPTGWISRLAPAALAGLLWNPWTFEFLIGTPSLYPAWARLAVCAPALCVAALCAASGVWPRRRILAKLALSAVSVVLVAPLVAEALIRLGIARDVHGLREPGLYADPLADDDYAKLAYAWNSDIQERVRVDADVHPIIGWTGPATRTDPPLVVDDEALDFPAGDEMALFFGDSFVGGVPSVPAELSLPAQLDARLPGLAVYNCGVGGYGVDQSYLRFKEITERLAGRRPVILFGVLTQDLDRTVVSVRDHAPKPLFTLADGELVLTNVPIGDRLRWFDEHPIGIRSFFAAFVARRMRWADVGGRWWESGYRREAKMQVNRRILEEVVRLARAQDLPLVFVLFVNKGELRAGWRAPFLAQVFDELGVPWVDTRPILAVSDRVYTPDMHLNGHGNAVVAEAIAERLGRGLGGRAYEVREPSPLEAFAMFTTRPDAVVCDRSPERHTLREREVVLVRAPAEMRFAVGAGAWLVRGPDGAERELWSALLDPARAPEHRPPQPLELALETDGPSEILLRTDNGPAGRTEGDLAFWTGVEISARSASGELMR